MCAVVFEYIDESKSKYIRALVLSISKIIDDFYFPFEISILEIFWFYNNKEIVGCLAKKLVG